MAVPTEKEFRDAGWTLAALQFPISLEAKTVRCIRNGITVDKAPNTWNYAPNAYVRDELEKAAKDMKHAGQICSCSNGEQKASNP